MSRKRRQRDFSECFLKRRSITTDSYPSRKPHGFPAQSTGGSAPTSCGIGRVGFSIRPIVARGSSGERWRVPNRMPIPLLPKRKFRNSEDQRRNCRMNRDRQPDRQPDPKETLPAGNQPTGSLESQGYVGLRIPPGFLSGFCRCGVRIDPTSKKNSANAWHNSPESFLESGIRFDRY